MKEKQNLILVNEFEKRAKERRENILHFQSYSLIQKDLILLKLLELYYW